MTGELDVAGLAEVLVAHRYRESTAGRAAHCSCGTWLLGNAELTHQEHQAAELLARVRPTLDRLAAAESAVERVRVLADSMEREAPKPQAGGWIADQLRAALDQGDGSAS